MTSPALLVLFLAHVCAIFGTASHPAADHEHRNMKTHNNIWTNSYNNLENNVVSHDEIYTDDDDFRNTDLHITNLKIDESDTIRKFDNRISDNKGITEDILYHKSERVKRNNKAAERIENKTSVVKNRIKRDENYKCDSFTYSDTKPYITHPHETQASLYSNNTDCVTVVTVPEGHVIELTFVDHFHIENHPDCAYDYLEIRDGKHGYSDLMGLVCGQAFPRVMTTRGPHAWLKFHSDDTIEYEGFNIKVEKIPNPTSYSIPTECNITEPGLRRSGTIKSSEIPKNCREGCENHGLDVLWTIRTPPDTKIFLNFTQYELESPNQCDKNGIQIFGDNLELSSKLEYYCGSVANPVTTKDDKGDTGNIMYVRLYTAKTNMDKEKTKFEATYTAFRTTNPSSDKETCRADEFDCADNTCIDVALKCDRIAHCRLKTDEDEDLCRSEVGSPIKELHILVILVIFSLILSAMMFVFLFKCIRKLYQDHKIIKEHIRQSCEDRLDRLDSLVGSRLTLDAKRLQRDSEPRASLERENQANEMFKRKRESYSKRQPTSIDSDFQETQIDIVEEIWRREVETQAEPENVSIERNGRARRDTSRKEESIRSKRESEDRKEIRDVSVGAPDTKESGCQTRESLFQTDPPVSSDGSGSNSRGFSTFGYSGATLVRPSPPTNTSEITIELLKHAPRQESVKSQKKIDRRPMSTETTRSAPDVIIVSKPVR